MLKIDIQESDIESLRQYYIAKQVELKSRMDEIESESKRIDLLLGQLKLAQVLPTTYNKIQTDFGKTNPVPSGYSESLTWADKIEFVMKRYMGSMVIKEIIDAISDLEPKYISDRKTAVRSISATLSAQSKGIRDRFVKNLNERGEYVYGLNNIK
jgi:hypothetical protein